MKNSNSRRSFIKKSVVGMIVATNAALVSQLTSAITRSAPECTPDNDCTDYMESVRSIWGIADDSDQAQDDAAKANMENGPFNEMTDTPHKSESYLDVLDPGYSTFPGSEVTLTFPIGNGKIGWMRTKMWKTIYCEDPRTRV